MGLHPLTTRIFIRGLRAAEADARALVTNQQQPTALALFAQGYYLRDGVVASVLAEACEG